MPTDPSRDLWETHASWWIDGFTEGADPEYTEQIEPLVAEWIGDAARIVDIGCGDGQLARMLAASGSAVVGVDPTRNQISVAAARGGGPGYVRAAAHELPVATASVDAVLACLVFEHIDALDDAIAEVARVLVDGGRFLFLLNHPLLQTPGSGWIDDQILDPPEHYWRIGPYLDEAATYEEVEAGVNIRFVHRPLHVYVNTLAELGFRIVHLAEPPPPEGFLARSPAYREAAAIPRLMALVLERVDARPSRVDQRGMSS